MPAGNQNKIQIKRVYDDPAAEDGARVLVDRLWPRGVSKERADLTEWLKEVAPSDQLRRWYGHDPAKFDEFALRYRVELHDHDHAAAFDKLQALAHQGPLTLLTATKAVGISEAAVLLQLLTPGTDQEG